MKKLFFFFLTLFNCFSILSSNAQTWTIISAGSAHSAAIKSDGTLWCWGLNQVGSVGDGTGIDRFAPVQIGTGNDWDTVIACGNHTIALKTNGTLWVWGQNDFGQLGLGSLIDQWSPVQLGTDNDWVQITAGTQNTFARKSNGTVYGAGWNAYGQLGDGTFNDRNTFLQIGTASDWNYIVGGNYNILAKKTNGTLWGWGNNNSGMLGDGTIILRTVPTQVASTSPWVSLFCGGEHSVGVKTDGTLWAWGENLWGQIGDGSGVNQLSPVQIGTDNNWLMVRAGDFHNFAIKTDGSLWGWGMNESGQLGIGTFDPLVATPQLINPSDTWVNVAPGSSHSVAIKTGGAEFCATGYNLFGQVGDGTNVSRNTFYCAGGVVCVPPPAPTVTDTTVCLGTTAVLTANGTGTIGWYDSPVGGLYLGGGSTYTTPALFSNTLFFVQDSTCNASIRTAVTVSVSPLPLVEITNTTGTTVLNCSVTTINVAATGAVSYAWDGGLGNLATASITAPGTYTVTGTNAGGCTAQAVITVTQVNSVTTPATVYGPVNVCPYVGTADQLVYSVDPDPAADSYEWIVPPTVNLVNGQGTNSITVTILPGFIASANKLIRVRALSACGNSAYKRFYLVAQLPGTPSSIITSTYICPFIGTGGTVAYKISKVAGATDYIWQEPVGTTITHPNGPGINDTIVELAFNNNYVTGIITVRASNSCGTSNARSLTVARINPSTPGLISGPANPCEYMAPDGIPAVYSIANVANADSYTWSLPAGATSVIGQGTNTISFIYPAGFTTGTISVSASNGCGSSAARFKTINLLGPGAPPPINVTPGQPCPNRTIIYSIPQMPSNATSILWTVPSGGVIISGQGTTSIIVSYPNTSVTGTVTAASYTNCSTSGTRSVSVNLASCRPLPPVPKVYTTTVTDAPLFSVDVYSNPAVDHFRLVVNTVKREIIKVRLFDLQGREIKRMQFIPGNMISFGSELQPGTYLAEVSQANKSITKRLIKL